MKGEFCKIVSEKSLTKNQIETLLNQPEICSRDVTTDDKVLLQKELERKLTTYTNSNEIELAKIAKNLLRNIEKLDIKIESESARQLILSCTLLSQEEDVRDLEDTIFSTIKVKKY